MSIAEQYCLLKNNVITETQSTTDQQTEFTVRAPCRKTQILINFSIITLYY